MTGLSPVGQRCANHPQRESSARCLACGRFYCRECVTEHEGRITCAACLGGPATARRERRALLGRLATPMALFGALALAFASFYMTGRALLALPDVFHGGVLTNASSIVETGEDARP